MGEDPRDRSWRWGREKLGEVGEEGSEDAGGERLENGGKAGEVEGVEEGEG